LSHLATVQFGKAGKLYDFDPGNNELTPGDRVVVETERGLSIAQVVRISNVEEAPAAGKLSAVIRKADENDMATLVHLAAREKESFQFCVKRIIERNLPMKLVRVEYQFDGSKAVFFFTSDGRVDFRDLVKDLAHYFHTRIEMRQIGVRDESKMIGGIGICGRELCCCSFLRDFQPVSVKMAKEQNLALNPTKISGQCGRLLCCLDYEYETYCCLRKNYPKAGKRVSIANTSGIVDKVNILTGNITLKLDDNKTIVIRREEILADGTATQPGHQVAPVIVEKGDSPSPSHAPRKTRERSFEQRRKQDKPAIKTIAPSSEVEQAAETVTEHTVDSSVGEPDTARNAPARKKNRSRKHGQRSRKQNAPSDGSTPSPPSGV